LSSPNISNARTLDLYFLRGEARTLEFSVKDSDGAPVDITGWAIEAEVKAAVGDADPALVTRPGVITDAVNGLFTVTFVTADTDRDPVEWVWDLWRTDGANQTPYVAPSAWVVKESVNLP